MPRFVSITLGSIQPATADFIEVDVASKRSEVVAESFDNPHADQSRPSSLVLAVCRTPASRRMRLPQQAS